MLTEYRQGEMRDISKLMASAKNHGARWRVDNYEEAEYLQGLLSDAGPVTIEKVGNHYYVVRQPAV